MVSLVGFNFSHSLGLLIAAAILGGAVGLWREGGRAAAILLALGAVSFLGTSLFPLAGGWLDHIEFPTRFQTYTMRAPDGGRYSAIQGYGRVQRYSSRGEFQNGWFVDSAGGILRLGLSKDGHVVAFSARQKKAEVFNPEGNSVHAPVPFQWRRNALDTTVILQGDVEIDGIELVNVQIADNPTPSWLMLPIWHPLAGWLLIVAAFVLRWLARKQSVS